MFRFFLPYEEDEEEEEEEEEDRRSDRRVCDCLISSNSEDNSEDLLLLLVGVLLELPLDVGTDDEDDMVEPGNAKAELSDIFREEEEEEEEDEDPYLLEELVRSSCAPPALTNSFDC